VGDAKTGEPKEGGGSSPGKGVMLGAASLRNKRGGTFCGLIREEIGGGAGPRIRRQERSLREVEVLHRPRGRTSYKKGSLKKGVNWV